mgnify:CR=1 FL=1
MIITWVIATGILLISDFFTRKTVCLGNPINIEDKNKSFIDKMFMYWAMNIVPTKQNKTKQT